MCIITSLPISGTNEPYCHNPTVITSPIITVIKAVEFRVKVLVGINSPSTPWPKPLTDEISKAALYWDVGTTGGLLSALVLNKNSSIKPV